MAKDGHRDIPGLPGGAGWCNTDQDYCGGEQGPCECCGGEMSEAKRGSLPESPQQPEPAQPQPEPEVPPGSVQPDVHPDPVRTAENPDAATDVPVAGEPMGKDQGA